MDTQEYAWKWFEYHAGQRLIAFRYYLVLAGALAVGIEKGSSNHNLSLVYYAAGLGVIISVVFFLLEIRNVQLVNIGRNALKAVEEDFKKEVLKLATRDRNDRTWLHHFVSYNLWLKAIYLLCGAAFTYVCKFPSTVMP